jgi:predicted DNA-binding protein (MmcQ/YjbR family)
MTIDEYKEYCLSFIAATEDYDIEEELLAYRVMGKPFALTNPDKFEHISLKCDPVKAATLRNLYDEVQPGNHVSKRHWNTVDPNGNLDDEIIQEWIRDSYNLVIEALPRKKQRKIEAMAEEE